jgi:hypothetical protein
MKNKAVIFCLLFISFYALNLAAQDLNVAWSERQLYENKKDGFFDDFIGSNSKYVFAKYNNLAYRPRKANRKIKIVALDRVSMKEMASVAVVGFPENEATKAKHIGLDYYKTIVFENVLYVFWVKDTKNRQELFVESFDAQLKRVNQIKKVYELNSDSKSKKKAALFVMGNKNAGEKIIIGGERAGAKESSIQIEYKLLNSDFSFSSSNTVTLPITVVSKSYGLSSSYEFGVDGNLHVKSIVTMTKEERKGLAKGESYQYPIFSVIDLNSGKIKTHSFKFDSKNIFYSDIKIDGSVTKIYAFFCDLQKDPSGVATHGIVTGFLNNQSFELENVNFSYFTKPQLDKLFANDKADQKKGKALFKSKKKAKSDEESLKDDYVIEAVQSIDKDNLVLFCTRMHNYSTTTCDGKGNCVTHYYCEKRNVTAFKLDKAGAIVWASNLDRSMTYNGWDIEDLKVIHFKDQFIVTYGSAYLSTDKASANGKTKVRHSRKSKGYMADRFEYAVFDCTSGNYTKKEYKVNPINVKKENKKLISAVNIKVIDNEMYTPYTKVRYKAWPFLTACGVGLAASALELVGMSSTPQNNAIVYPAACLSAASIPFFIISGMNSNFKKGSGYLGKISPVK